jgi:hypothetical protein
MNQCEKQKVLRYGELATRKARNDIKPEEVAEMAKIQTDLGLSHEQIIDKVEHLLHEGY